MSARVLLIDNYDSFTYNLVQALALLGAEVAVRRNDQVGVEEALAIGATHLVVSPGPGRPEAAGITMALLARAVGRLPVLGVCLGHQALALVLGARLAAARELVHGKASPVYHDGRTLYEGLPNPFRAGRYHSLAVAEEGLPPGLTVTAHTSDGEIMGLRHARLPVEGVQFHPESVLTPDGERLLRNFLDLPPALSPPADGVVVGSALIEALERGDDPGPVPAPLRDAAGSGAGEDGCPGPRFWNAAAPPGRGPRK